MKKQKIISIRKNIAINSWLRGTKLYWTFSAITGCVSVSAFASLLDIALNICTINSAIKKYKSIIKKKKKKHDKIVLLAKTKLNSIEVFISKALIDSFALVDNVSKECDYMKEDI